MTGPTNIVIGADVDQAVAGLQSVIRATILTDDTTKVLNKSLKDLKKTNEENGAAIQRTLANYDKLIKVSTTFNKMAKEEAASVEQVTATIDAMVTALAELGSALTLVDGVTAESYAAQSRQLGLYSQMIGITSQAATIKLREAQASTELAKAQAAEVASSMRVEAADRKVAAAAQAALDKKEAAAAAAAAAATAAAEAATTVIPVAEGPKVATAAAQEKLGAAVARNQAAFEALDVAAARNSSLLIQEAQDRLVLATMERERQEDVVRVLLEQAEVERKLAVAATARVSGPNPSSTAEDVDAAAKANARSATAARDAAAGVRNLSAAQLDEQRAAKAVSAAEAEEAAAIRAAAVAAEEAAAKQAAAADSQKQLTSHMASTRYALYQVAAAYGIVSVASLLLVKDAVRVGTQYDAAFAQVVRATNSTTAALLPLHDALESMATDIPVAFTKLSKVAQLGAQMGIGTSSLSSFTDTIAKFSATTNVSTDEAAASFGKLSNLLDVPITQFENLASTVSYLGVTSVATETQILAVATSISAAGHTAGLSTQELLGLSSAFASLAVSPEQARSAMSRLFLNVDNAISAGGDDLAAWSKTLGMTEDQFINLRKTNPDQFFNDIVQSFHKVIANGGDITGLFNDLGLKSIRDIQVFERLAGSWDLVAESVNNANIAYQDGTYLESSFATINDTIAAKAQKVADAYENLVASVGNSTVVTGAVKTMLDAVKSILVFLDKLPSGVSVGIVTFTTLLGLFAAYKAGLALMIAGTLAFKQTTQSGLGSSAVSWSALRAAISSTSAATTQQVTANAELVASSEAVTTVIDAQTVALRAQAGAAVAAGAANTGAAGAGAAGSAAKSLGTLSGALKGFASPLIVTGLLSFAVATYDHVKEMGNAASEAAAQYAQLKQSIIDAGGGLSSLTTAIQADTDAWEASNKTANDANGVYKTIELSAVPAAQAIDAFGAANQTIQGQVQETTKGLADQTLALGKNVQAWEANALSQYLLSNKIISADQIKAFQTEGVDIATAIAAGLKGDSNTFDSIFYPFVRKWQDELKSVKTLIGFYSLEELQQGGKTSGNEAAIVDLQKREKALEDLISSSHDLETNTDAANAAVQDAITSGSLFTKVLQQMGIITDDDTNGLGELADGAQTVATATDTATKSTQDLASAFQQVISSMTDIISQTDDLYGSMADLGMSIADNGTDFSAFTEGGRANMEALIKVVSGYGDVIAAQIANGTITAQQGAEQMQSYMASLIQELGNVGVPTEQIDFLVDYLNQVVQSQWGITIGADITPAVDGINTLAHLASQLQAQINGVISSMGIAGTEQGLVTGNLISYGLFGGVPSYKAVTASQQTTPSYTGKTDFQGGSQYSQIITASKADEDAANAAKTASAAQKDAAKDSKDAANSSKDASDAAADAAKAQTDYLNAASSYFGSFAKDSFSLVDATGDVFESLQKLGQSIVENGKDFNIVTDSGRKNFKALEDTMSSFGQVLSIQVSDGTLTAAQAMQQYQQYASGVYSELVSLGVPSKDVIGWFQAIGISTKGWTDTGPAVKQFAGYITAAADAVGNLLTQTDKTTDYVSRLSDALDAMSKSYFAISDAQDAVSSQYNDMLAAQQDEADQIQDLIDKNKELNQTIGDQTVVANKAYGNYLLAKKYGETGRAGDYYQQYLDAKGQVSGATKEVAGNTKQIDTLKKSKNLLTGNSKEAIANRKSLEDLTNTYKDQIEAYAAAGHTQAEVATYAKGLKTQFDAQALSLGYTKSQLKPYDAALDGLVTTIKKVPTSVTTDVKVTGVDASAAALAAIPKSGTYTVKPDVNALAKSQTITELGKIPKKADYVVTAKVSNPNAVKNAYGGAISVPITPKIAKMPTIGIEAKMDIDAPRVRPIVHVEAKMDIDAPRTKPQVGIEGIFNATALHDSAQRAFTDKPLSLEGTFKNGFTATTGKGGTLIMKPVYKGGMIGALGGGFAEGGLLPGTPPANPNSDNLLAMGPGGRMYGLRSREYIQPQPSVDYYGVGIMNALRERRIPRDRFYASGGSIGGSSGGSGSGWDGPVELSMADRQLLRQIRDAQPVLIVGDSAVAHSSSRGAESNTRRGGS